MEDANASVPRWADMNRWIPAERAIYDAKQVVENAGAHTLLTDAVVLLGQAQRKVAQWEDERRLANLQKAIWGPEEA